MKTLQSAPWKFSWELGLCCCPFWTFGQSLASSSHNSQPRGNIWNERRNTLQYWSARYRHEGIRAIRSSRHWIQLGRSAVDMNSVYRPGIDTRFPHRFWRFSDWINHCQRNNSRRWVTQGNFSSNNNNNNSRVLASDQNRQITKKSFIRDSTTKCSWFHIQDSVSLNFLFGTLFVFCIYK